MSITSINPADGSVLQRFEEASPADVSRALDDARAAFADWSRRPIAERAAMVQRAADHLESHVEALARLITVEMGKTIAESRAEVRKCAWCCRYFAEHGPRFLAAEPAPSSASESFVEFPPLGVVLAIMPWNFPLWQVFRFAAPALVAGNAAVLKHASNVPQCALAI